MKILECDFKKLKFIGRGSFSTVFAVDAETVLYYDNFEEVRNKKYIVGLKGKHIPVVNKFFCSDKKDFIYFGKWYRMEIKDPHALKIKKRLQDIYEKIRDYLEDKKRSKKETNLEIDNTLCQEVLQEVEADTLIPESIKTDLRTLYDRAKVFSDYIRFDFVDNNFAIDENRELILLDVICFRDVLKDKINKSFTRRYLQE